MRKILFAIVLVGASFLGGVFVNGPGMKWLQVKVLGHAGMGEEVQTLTLAPPPGGDPAPKPTSPAMGGPIPLAPASSPNGKGPKADLAAATPPRPLDPGAPKPEPEPAPAGAGGKSSLGNVLGSLLGGGNGDGAEKPLATDPSLTTAAGTSPSRSTPPKSTLALAARRAKAASPETLPVPASPPSTEASTRGAERPAPLDPSVTPAILASLISPDGDSEPPPGSAAARAKSAVGARVPVAPASTTAPGDAIPRPLPLPLPLPGEKVAAQPLPLPVASSGSPEPAIGGGSDEWGAIRRKLQALGVTRYSIEGEPGGRVSFSCLIPMAGRQAVTQRFEAEGDDELRAARAALRRIALWQATERDRSAR